MLPRSFSGFSLVRLTAYAVIVAVTIASAITSGALAIPIATVSRTLKITDESHLYRTSEAGSTIIEVGKATGTLPGRVTARLKVGSSISSEGVLHAHGGTINLRGVGVLKSSGVYASFAGTITANGGTGRYVHAHGKGGFYGVVNRRNWATTIQITGKLSY